MNSGHNKWERSPQEQNVPSKDSNLEEKEPLPLPNSPLSNK